MSPLLVALLAILPAGQDRGVEKQALDVAQHVSVRALDKSLEDRPFAEWFVTLVGNPSTVVWRVTDCGEGDGAGGAAVRDLPMCGEVVANLTRTRKAVVEIVVGSKAKGVSGAALWSAAILDGNDVRFFKTLPELAAAVRAK
jgi:hypothetical protein